MPNEINLVDLARSLCMGPPKQHTPGPWKLRTFGGERVPTIERIQMPHGEAPTFRASIVASDGLAFKHVVSLDFGYGKPEDEANANLIAAAPDMYAFLIALRDNDVPEQEQLEALIAKAEGR